MYGIMLIAVLVLMGGAIAFIGDRLGSKVGKKKLSIFGLRPRHTSVIVTIFTGICITTLTFAILSAASEDVRTALFGMDKLNKNMQNTQIRLKQVTEELGRATEDEKKAKSALASAQEKVNQLEVEQQRLSEESERLQRGNRQIKQENNALLARNEELGRKSEVLVIENKNLATQNNRLLQDNQGLEERAVVLRKDLLNLRGGNILYRAGEIIASGVIRGGRPIEDVRTDLATLAQLASRNVSARLAENKTDQDVWIYQPEFQSAAHQISSGKKDMVVRIVAAGNLLRGEPVRASIELYTNSVIYKSDEFIIARAYQMETRTQSEAEGIMMNFLKEINLTATSKGILPDPIRGSIGVMDAAQFYETTNEFAVFKGQFVLSAYAKEETDALGPLRLKFKVEPLSN